MMCVAARTRCRGISLIEILLTLGVLAVLFSLASPALSNATARSELRAAVENMEFSVRMARNTARQLETEVIMHFNAGAHEERHSLTFSFPAGNQPAGSAALLQNFTFSPEIRLAPDAPSVHFDSRGMVDSSIQIMLVSSHDDAINQRLVID